MNKLFCFQSMVDKKQNKKTKNTDIVGLNISDMFIGDITELV